MKYILDTNICIYIIKKKPEKVIKKFLTLVPGDIAVSVITSAELWYGVAKSSKPHQNSIALNQFMQPLILVDFNNSDAEIYGKIRTKLERRGKPIGAMDMLIASQCLSRNLTLVTNNEKEFRRIKDLKIENWIK